MIFVSRPASRLNLAIFASSTSGLVPLITSDPRPMGMANMVVKVNAPIARGFPRVPRTIQRHVGLFSHIHDMSPQSRTRYRCAAILCDAVRREENTSAPA